MMQQLIKVVGSNPITRKTVTLLFPQSFLGIYHSQKVSDKGIFTLSFDCEHKRDIQALPVVLDLADKYSVKFSFACIGKWIEKYPRIHKRLIKEGHEIINHTYSHPDNEELNPYVKFSQLTTKGRLGEVSGFDRICKKILGYAPKGFRVPHFGKQLTSDVYPILKKLGYKYSSSTICINTQPLPFMQNGIIEMPLCSCPKHPFAVMDSWHGLSSPKAAHKKDFAQMFEKILDMCEQNKTYLTVYADPADLIENNLLYKILDYAKSKKVVFKKYEDILYLFNTNPRNKVAGVWD